LCTCIPGIKICHCTENPEKRDHYIGCRAKGGERENEKKESCADVKQGVESREGAKW
jgi:hypothetical protein